VSACSCHVMCLHVHPCELLKLRKIADKQTTDRLVATHHDCNIVKDSASDTDHPQTTSKAVAAVFHRMPSRSSRVGTLFANVMKHTLEDIFSVLFVTLFLDTQLREF